MVIYWLNVSARNKGDIWIESDRMNKGEIGTEFYSHKQG